MSEPARAWHFFLDDMIDFAQRVFEYTAGLDQVSFEQNRLVYDATVRNIELIGEAARHIPQRVQDGAPRIPWRQIIATRNRLIHGYAGIDSDTLWSIVRDDMPTLLNELKTLRSAVASDAP